MAKSVLLMEQVFLNGTDYSTYVKKAELQPKADDKETTTFGSGGWKEHLGGLKEATLAVEMMQDFAAGSVDSVFWPLLGSVITFEVRPVQAARSASNPAYTGNVLVTDWNTISGSVGDVAMVSLSWPTTGAVARQIV